MSAPTSPFKPQSGFILIEALVTMLIVALGLLGAAGMQLTATRYQQTAGFRNQAYSEAQFIIEKMKVNNAALLLAAPVAPANAYLAPNDYASAGALPPDPSCGLSGQGVCTTDLAAQRDMREWRQSVALNLPAGRGSVFNVSGGSLSDPGARQIIVMWQEKSDLSTDNAENSAPTDSTCPPPLVGGVRCLTLVVTP